MQRGPKRQSADTKKLAGTYKESRDKPVHLVNETSLPKAPAYLTPEAKVVWHEEIERVGTVNSTMEEANGTGE